MFSVFHITSKRDKWLLTPNGLPLEYFWSVQNIKGPSPLLRYRGNQKASIHHVVLTAPPCIFLKYTFSLSLSLFLVVIYTKVLLIYLF
jgi:hypothetical protein